MIRIKIFSDPTDFYSDAPQLIDQYIYIYQKNSLRKQHTAYEAGTSSDMNITDEALPDIHKNESYDVRLIKVDVNYVTLGLYHFYRMQIIKHK
ncbi:unnamed protein product, partial [Rotaria magnacalcarata]